MADYKLKAAAFLGGYARKFDGVELREIDDLALVSLALPLGKHENAITAIEKAFGINMPDVGRTTQPKPGAMRLLRLGQDQIFVSFPHDGTDPEPYIAGKLNGAAYSTDQTHVWVALEISGPVAERALERICPIDLDKDHFTVGQLARTSMEHLGVIILRTGAHTFVLMSASSSAKSFLHAVETSIANVT